MRLYDFQGMKRGREGMALTTGSGRIVSLWQSLRLSYQRFAEFARPDRRIFWLNVLAIVVAVITNTMMIWLMGQPISLAQVGDYDALLSVLLLFAIVLLINQASQLAGGMLGDWLALRFVGRVRNALMSKVFSLSFPVAGRMSRGDLLARLSNDVSRVSDIWILARLMLVSHLLTLCLYVFMLFWIDVRLALIAMATLPLFLFHQQIFSRRNRHASEGFLRTNGELLACEEQGLANLRGTSSNNAESRMSALHRSMFGQAFVWAIRERRLEVGFDVSFTLLIYLVGLLVILFGVKDVSDGSMLVGQLVSFLLYLGYITVPVRGLADLGFQLAGNQPAAERIKDVFDEQPNVQDVADAKDLKVPHGAIELDAVSFAYEEGVPVLENARVCIEPGETVALVGPSGSGKSTLASLLLRFYDPQQGRILIDGQDLRGVSLRSVRHQVSVVWQDTFLINETIRANLLMARDNATDVQLEEACRRSHCWTFIDDLSQGLDTRLGAGGVELSGGQRQRLAIAQAFLRDAPILILDEASSALDSQSEQAIVQDLDALRADRTTLVIAHRYSSIRSAHRVIYFEGNGSLSVGSHESLMAKHLAYCDAVEWQTGSAVG